MKDCTFKPLTGKEDKIRTQDEFLESSKQFLKNKEDRLNKAKQEVYQKETAGLQVKKGTYNEKEFLDRFTKKEEKKSTYKDPNTTFTPQLSKKTEKLLSKKGHRDTFEALT